MADRDLTLTASVKDTATPTLRRIKGAIANLKKTPGMEGLGKQLENVTNQVQRFSKGGSEAALATGSLGLAALAAGGSIVALGAKFRALALHANSLKEISRETGLTINQLNQLQQVAPRFGVNADQITKAMETWADKMIDVRRGWGDVVSQLNGQGLGDFVKKLQRDNPAQAVHDIFALLGSDKLMANPALQKRWTAMFLGDGGLVSLFQKGGKGIEQAWAHTAANLDPINKNLVKNADAMRNALADLNIQISNLENVVAPPVFKAMTVELESSARAAGMLIADLKALDRSPFQALGKIGAKEVPGGPVLSKKQIQDQNAYVKAHPMAASPLDPLMNWAKTLWSGGKPSSAAPRIPLLNAPHDLMQGGLDKEKLHKESFSGSTAGLRQNIADRSGAGLGAGARMFERAVESGVLRGLIDFENRTALNDDALGADSLRPGGAPRPTYASYGRPGAPGGLGGIRRGAAGSGSALRPHVFAPGAHIHVPRLGGGVRSAGSAPGSVVGGMSSDPILNEVSKAEGTRGYNDSFAHQLHMNLADKTMAQIEQIQRGMHGSSAIGRYQFMRNTLFGSRGHPGLVQQMHIGMGQKFTPQLQELFAHKLLERRGYDQWRHGKLSDKQFMSNLAHEWAGLTDPRTGRGVYPGQTTGHSIGEEFGALRAERNHADILGLAAKAGVLHHTIRHDGGADVRVRFDGGPPIRGVSSATSGMVRSIQVNRGTSMMETREV